MQGTPPAGGVAPGGLQSEEYGSPLPTDDPGRIPSAALAGPGPPPADADFAGGGHEGSLDSLLASSRSEIETALLEVEAASEAASKVEAATPEAASAHAPPQEGDVAASGAREPAGVVGDGPPVEADRVLSLEEAEFVSMVADLKVTLMDQVFT
mmetsp:Transcript_21824/g.46990  ORF Transcript_21824/g.46990 Transcript_21824/m.46990 type:complete len:154 (-) Transcript_21824:111-572(-)